MLVAEDELSNKKIAAEVGVTRQTIDAWRKQDIFTDRVDRIRRNLRAAIVAQGIANKQNRIDAANGRHEAFTEIVRQRAELYAEQVGGANTGWLLLTHKFSPEGSIIEEWAVDTGLNTAMTALEKQVAQETGQWNEAPAASAGIKIEIVGVDISRLLGTDGGEG